MLHNQTWQEEFWILFRKKEEGPPLAIDQKSRGHYHCLLARCGMKQDLTVVMSPPITTLISISINKIEYGLNNLEVLEKNLFSIVNYG